MRWGLSEPSSAAPPSFLPAASEASPSRTLLDDLGRIGEAQQARDLVELKARLLRLVGRAVRLKSFSTEPSILPDCASRAGLCRLLKRLSHLGSKLS